MTDTNVLPPDEKRTRRILEVVIAEVRMGRMSKLRAWLIRRRYNIVDLCGIYYIIRTFDSNGFWSPWSWLIAFAVIVTMASFEGGAYYLNHGKAKTDDLRS